MIKKRRDLKNLVEGNPRTAGGGESDGGAPGY